MLKFLLVGVLGCVASLAGLMASKMMHEAPAATHAESASKVAQVKTDMAGIPVISKGQVTGYLVFQVSSTIDSDKLPSPDFSVAPYLQDAAVRAGFQTVADGITTVNAALIEALGERLRREANQRLGSDIVVAVNVEAFNYVPKEDIRGNMLAGNKKHDGH